MRRYGPAALVVAALAVVVAVACSSPPPDAPAHGWRRKQDPPPTAPSPPPPSAHQACIAACESTYGICWNAEEKAFRDGVARCMTLPPGVDRDSCIAQNGRRRWAAAQACLDAENSCIHGCP